MSRHTAREHLFKMIFQREFHDEAELLTVFDDYYEKISDESPNDIQFIKDGIKGVLTHKELIDEQIHQFAVGWTVERLAKVDIAILRLAIYELNFSDVPKKVVVNEAVEIAKEFSTDDSPSFINGILRNVLLSLGEVDE